MKLVEHSAKNIAPRAGVPVEKWSQRPSEEALAGTVRALEKRGFAVFVAEDSARALEKVRELIPVGSKVMNGSSTTLAEIGFADLLMEGRHGWRDLHAQVLAEKDFARQGDVRRRAIVDADVFVSGVNAISQEGEIVACDATGSRVGAFLFAAKSMLLVSGVNKIVPTLDDALSRVREYAYPLENERAKLVYGAPSAMNKMVVYAGERPGRTTILLVKEILGY